jgi:hypothetical protein
VNAIMGGLKNFVIAEVMHFKSKNEIWDKIQILYEGDA